MFAQQAVCLVHYSSNTQATNNQQTHTMSSTINTSPAHTKTLLTRKRAVLNAIAQARRAHDNTSDKLTDEQHYAIIDPLYAEYETLKNELDAIDDIICAENAELERRINTYYEL